MGELRPATIFFFLPSPRLNKQRHLLQWWGQQGDARGLCPSWDSAWAYVNLFNLRTQRCALWTANNVSRITKGHQVKVRVEVIHSVLPLCQDETNSCSESLQQQITFWLLAKQKWLELLLVFKRACNQYRFWRYSGTFCGLQLTSSSDY